MEDEYRYAIAYDDDVVRVSTSGNFDYLKGLQMWQEIVATCEQHECCDVLAVSGMEKPIPAPDVFNSGEFFATVGITDKYRLAVVNKNDDVRESHKIAAKALQNRAPSATFKAGSFSSERDARRWLSRQD